MKRASTPEKKDARRASILERARIWLKTSAFEEIRLADLARELDVAKGTLYLYFPTKQDLFASILVEEAELWWIEFMTRLPVASPGTDLALTLEGRTLLLRLFSSLHSSIEPGFGREALLRFKLWFADFSGRAAVDAERRYPALSGQGLIFIMRTYALIVGAAQLAFPSERVATMIREEDSLASFRVGFSDFLAGAVDALYQGMVTSGT